MDMVSQQPRHVVHVRVVCMKQGMLTTGLDDRPSDSEPGRMRAGARQPAPSLSAVRSIP